MCPYCEFTYSPCPIHDPAGHAAHQAEVADRLGARSRALAELSARWGELPDWAQRDIALVCPVALP